MRVRMRNVSLQLLFHSLTLRNVKRFGASVVTCLFLLGLGGALGRAQSTAAAPQGLAWQVSGVWFVDGKNSQIINGDYLQPGSLLQPARGASKNSITVVLPDGQRISYECLTVVDCARGFRVPSLYREPDPFAAELLERIHKGLAQGSQSSSDSPAAPPEVQLPRDEIVTAIDGDNKVRIGGLASRLPNARYTYDLRPLDRRSPTQPHLAVTKSGPEISIPLPGPGQYELTFTDELNSPRIDVFVAALTPEQGSIEQSFHRAKKMMVDWNEDYYAWPIHDFVRAYVESFFPLGNDGEEAKAAASAHALPGTGAEKSDARKVTAEPEFVPSPGLFKSDQEVKLLCATPGAAMHFTVDGSQPLASSPVYNAPIVVKGSELTIKAFASAAGKKDSPVVTGIFRIQVSK
jgi:hypothetical protein